jgi:23S rRNA (pseudouridine1915-N3)-methyltransferase
MRLRLIAVGTRMPHWVDAAYEDYARRLRRPWSLTLTQIAPAYRREGAKAAQEAKAAEARRILALLSTRDCVVPLDEHASEPSTLELVHWLDQRRAAGQDLAFIIGGPDGLADEVLARAHFRWSLSRLTLPHALARVVLVEQLYRAAMVLSGHPYHRG